MAREPVDCTKTIARPKTVEVKSSCRNNERSGNRSQWTRAEKDELRAMNKCSNCKNTGHQAKDCPSRNNVRPTGPQVRGAAVTVETNVTRISDSSAALQELERLSEVHDRLEVSAVAYTESFAAEPRRVARVEALKSIERNATCLKDASRLVPPSLVVGAKIAGKLVRVLIDSGSQTDSVSTTVADQLRLKLTQLTKPFTLQLTVTGSRGSINCNTTCRFEYQNIDEQRTFDIANIDNYDVILGMPFLFQHQVRICLNPLSIYIGSGNSLAISGSGVIRVSSIAADEVDARVKELRRELATEAEELCKGIDETPLPSLRDINHTISLTDEDKVDSECASKCPKAMKGLYDDKYRMYVESGQWKHATGSNATPMLYLKMKTKDGSLQLCTVLDKSKKNTNTRKLVSPLLDIEETLETVSRYKYRTVLDGKDAYKRIWVAPDHVPRTLFHMPHGTMVSLVMQQGDCNAGATYQSMMNHIFAAYISVIMYIYLDDISIF